jgi:DNA-binding transcriptional ArsR family regulator
MTVAAQAYFAYRETMDATAERDAGTQAGIDTAVSSIAAAIAEPARTRMLFALLDGHARTGTELAMVGEVSPSTASVHLARLRTENLVQVYVQGRHRYYSLAGPNVARALERLSVLAGGARRHFVPHTPEHLRKARSCYDHMAGAIAVALHDHFFRSSWIARENRSGNAYELTADGNRALLAVGLDVGKARGQRRRFAYGCLDWSERRPHLGGSLGAALLDMALSRRWLVREYDSRALTITRAGEREFNGRFGIEIQASS